MRGLGMPRLRNSAAFTSMNSSFAFLFLDAREKKHLYYGKCMYIGFEFRTDGAKGIHQHPNT